MSFFRKFKRWQLALGVFLVVLMVNAAIGTLKYGLFYITIPANLFDDVIMAVISGVVTYVLSSRL